ncbi:hypothetical protein M5K25_026661 [Dendrobium thyrsiflorum]|uniref:Uncharacterized protein n=1 Tax=Dendrobium thyrsiflorum TaxID=117978 RepID=A0ABD0TXR8_DENTH
MHVKFKNNIRRTLSISKMEPSGPVNVEVIRNDTQAEVVLGMGVAEPEDNLKTGAGSLVEDGSFF